MNSAKSIFKKIDLYSHMYLYHKYILYYTMSSSECSMSNSDNESYEEEIKYNSSDETSSDDLCSKISDSSEIYENDVKVHHLTDSDPENLENYYNKIDAEIEMLADLTNKIDLKKKLNLQDSPRSYNSECSAETSYHSDDYESEKADLSDDCESEIVDLSDEEDEDKYKLSNDGIPHNKFKTLDKYQKQLMKQCQTCGNYYTNDVMIIDTINNVSDTCQHCHFWLHYSPDIRALGDVKYTHLDINVANYVKQFQETHNVDKCVRKPGCFLCDFKMGIEINGISNRDSLYVPKKSEKNVTVIQNTDEDGCHVLYNDDKFIEEENADFVLTI